MGQLVALRIRIANSEAGQHDFELRPKGLSSIQPVKGQMDIKPNPNADHSTFNIVVNLNNLKLDKAGKYSQDERGSFSAIAVIRRKPRSKLSVKSAKVYLSSNS